ncbi:hypothetical protein [Celeribacter sp.]|uniref:hypothetical protein n=1 Tax=Celeribacter sp. TaxID=1890673 RepID=UPI003A9404A4
MATDVGTYFDCLESYFAEYYKLARGVDEIKLKEKVDTRTGQVTRTVDLKFSSPTFALKLDKKNGKGNVEPLFHFFNDTSQPWSKRCDFVLFQREKRCIGVYALEFKSENIPADTVKAQLERTESWCRCVHSIVQHYTGDKVPFQFRKFLLTDKTEADAYLQADGKYLRVDPKIRHFNYADVRGQTLEELDHERNIKIS